LNAEDTESIVRPVYAERAALIAFIAACYPSVMVLNADPAEPGRAVLFIDTPRGQLSWHIAEADLGLFGHVTTVAAGDSRAPAWDGHSTRLKYERLNTLALDISRSGGIGHQAGESG